MTELEQRALEVETMLCLGAKLDSWRPLTRWNSVERWWVVPGTFCPRGAVAAYICQQAHRRAEGARLAEVRDRLQPITDGYRDDHPRA